MKKYKFEKIKEIAINNGLTFNVNKCLSNRNYIKLKLDDITICMLTECLHIKNSFEISTVYMDMILIHGMLEYRIEPLEWTTGANIPANLDLYTFLENISQKYKNLKKQLKTIEIKKAGAEYDIG